jgi:hypothetical protein
LFVNFRWTFTFCFKKPYDGMHLTATQPALPLPNKHSSQVKYQCQWQCCHTKHKKFPYQPTCDVSLLSGNALYIS